MLPKLKSFLKFIGYTAALILGTIIVLITSAVILWNNYNDEIYYKEKFDEQKWKAAESFYDKSVGYYLTDYNCTRGQMIKDLEYKYLKNLTDKSLLLSKLGTPRSQRQYTNLFGNTRICDEYVLGACRYAEKNNLVLCYNADQKLNKFFISRIDDKGKIINYGDYQ